MDTVRIVGPVAWLGVPTEDGRVLSSLVVAPGRRLTVLALGSSPYGAVDAGEILSVVFAPDGEVSVVADVFREVAGSFYAIPCGMDLGALDVSNADENGVQWMTGTLLGLTLYVGENPRPAFPKAHLAVVGK